MKPGKSNDLILLMSGFSQKIFIAVILLFVAFNSFSQQSKIEFSHFGVKEGLGQGDVQSIIQDSENYIWLGTRHGLYKYDGYNMIVYKNNPDDITSISDNHIVYLFEDSKKKLWIGTPNGLNLYNREQNNFSCFKHDPQNNKTISGNGVQTIYEDKKGNVWIGLHEINKGGLNLYDNKGNFIHYRYNANNKTSVGSNVIKCFYEDDNNNLWIGLNNGISLYNYKKKTFITYRVKKGVTNYLNGGDINEIVADKNKNIWIATQDGGLNVFNRKTKTFKHYLHNEKDAASLGSNAVYCLLIDDKKNLWVGGENSGLQMYNSDTDNFTTYKHIKNDLTSLTNNSVIDMHEDTNHNIWIGTYGGGANMFSVQKKNFRHYHEGSGDGGLSANHIKGFCEDHKGNVWIATDGGGLSMFNPKKNSFITYRHSHNTKSIGVDAVTCVHEDNHKMLWVGTWGNGLNLLDRKTNTFKHYVHDPKNKNSISANEVNALLEDKNGNLWVSTFYEGFNLYNSAAGTFKRYACNFRNERSRISGLCEDKDGYLWIGTNSSGIGKFDPAKEIFVDGYDLAKTNSHGLVGKGVCIIFEDSKGILWVGTERGLNMLNAATQKFSYINEIEDLDNEPVNGIVEDNHGNLWLSTLNGIIKFDPVTKNSQRFKNEDGLQVNEFLENACLKTSTGEIYFGGNNGFNVFHPDSLTKNNFIPPVYFTDFQIFNQSVMPGKNSPLSKHISKTKEIVLSYKQSVISFEFAALNYTNPRKNEYAYMLEGFDKRWNYAGTKRNVTYTNLNSGEYILKVKASNNDGLWNEKGASIKLIITPPFWRTWWAYILYAAAIVAGLYIFRRYSIIQIKVKNKLLIERLRSKKAAEITEAKMHFFTNISHEIRTPLTLIAGPLERVLKEDDLTPVTKKDLVSVSRNVKRLLGMANQLLQFRKLDLGYLELNPDEVYVLPFIKDIITYFEQHARLKSITISLENKISDNTIVPLDKEMITTVFYNLLSNAVKFTGHGGSITLQIYESSIPAKAWYKEFKNPFASKQKNNAIAIEVRDTGKGIAKEDLQNIFKEFYQLPDQQSEVSGSGLGLALVKEYVELHQGCINVKSKLHDGTSFTVYLPNELKTEKKKLKVESINAMSILDKDLAALNERMEYVSKQLDTPLKPIGKESPLVLIIEDDAELAVYLKDSLSKSFKIEIAEDGKKGLEKALRLNPELIISDIAMPEMNGYNLCEEIKSNIHTSHIPVILLTAKAEDENILIGYNRGADAYIPKPFNVNILESQAKSLIRSRMVLQEKYRKMMLIQPSEISADSPNEKFLKQLMEVTEKNMVNSGFDVAALVQEMGMSHSSLFKKIKTLTGLSLVEFIRNTRLKKAAIILKKENLSVSEVCYKVGFDDPKYFRKCFAKEFGVTPSEYKSEM